MAPGPRLKANCTGPGGRSNQRDQYIWQLVALWHALPQEGQENKHRVSVHRRVKKQNLHCCVCCETAGVVD